MTDEPESIQLASVTHIPRVMLLIVVIDLMLWFVALPAAFGLRYGNTAWFELAGIGLLFVPIGVMALFIRRLWMYFVTIIYWYLVGFAALVSILFAVIFIGAIFLVSTPPPRGFDPQQALALVPASAAQPLGALVLILALIAVFVLGRMSGKRSHPKPKTTTPTKPPSPLAQIGDEQKKIRQQLNQRTREIERMQKR